MTITTKFNIGDKVHHIIKRKSGWIVKRKKYIVEGIKVAVLKKNIIEMYSISRNLVVNHTDIFRTFGSAQIECKNRNKNEQK